MRIGWRLACIRRLSSRDSVHFTGRCSSQAASAVWAWLRHVLLAAEGAAVGDELDGDLLVGQAEHRGDVVAVVPHALAAASRRAVAVPSAAGTASVRLGLQEGVLDALGLERLVHDVGAGGERGVDVAAGVRRLVLSTLASVPHTAISRRRLGRGRRRGSVIGRSTS